MGQETATLEEVNAKLRTDYKEKLRHQKLDFETQIKKLLQDNGSIAKLNAKLIADQEQFKVRLESLQDSTNEHVLCEDLNAAVDRVEHLYRERNKELMARRKE